MSDLIDRRMAIKAIEDLPNCHNGYSDTYDKACIIGVLEQVPSAQPERKWISCSERLPEDFGYYIATAYDGHMCRIAYVRFAKRTKTWELTGRMAHWKVIAWMPLPNCYQGG